MRLPAPRFLLLFVMALFVAGASARVAHADPRADAKVHYQAGVKAYSVQDYQTAIKEFSAAQAIMPADLNNYNLALCYDKLGQAESAIQYYKEYLAKVPNADKRVEIEASIARLDAALQSAAAKKADEQRKADEAAKADAARKAEEARKIEEARRAEEAKRQPPTGTGDPVTGNVDANVGVGSTGTPGTGQAVSTGDAQLDRVAGIDVNQVRDQRVGGAGSGMPDNRQGPGGPNGMAPTGGGGGAGMQANASAGTGGPTAPVGPDDKPVKKETPVYKKWWFWAVVAVSAYVVYSIAVDGSSSNTRAREVLPPTSPNADPTAGTALFRF
jgi:hypothetical protein